MLDIFMACASCIFISFVLSIASTFYTEKYINNTHDNLSVVISKNKTKAIIFGTIFLLFSMAGLFFYVKKQLSLINFTQAIVLWDSLLAVAFIDYKVKKIPNFSLVFILIVRVLFIIVGAINAPNNLKYELFQSVLGMFVGGFIILACLLISRGGIGAGDFKLFAVLGLYYGLSGIIQIMMYSLFFAAIYSIVMLISKKAKLKTTMAMAPFILCGLTVYLLFAAVME